MTTAEGLIIGPGENKFGTIRQALLGTIGSILFFNNELYVLGGPR